MLRHAWPILVLAALAGCGSAAPAHHASSSGSGSTGGAAGAGASGSSTGASGGSGASSTGGSCEPNDTQVGAGNGALCCSHFVDATGQCATPGQSTTSSSSTTGATSSSSTTSSGATSGASTTATSTSTSTSTSGTSTTGATGTSGSTGACYANGLYVGPGQDSFCCSGYANAGGYCADPSATTSGSTGGGSTSGGTTTSTTTSGGSTGGATCPSSCYLARGYHCENGQCVLNGATGALQVTLQWDRATQLLQPDGGTPPPLLPDGGPQRAREDMDLHVIEPKPDGGAGGCEIYYGDTNVGGSSSCGAIGWLDLDQNAGCGDTDNNGGIGDDTENVIYPDDGGAPHGKYTVYVVDYADNCDTPYPVGSDPGTDPSPYTWHLTVRAGAQTYEYVRQFNQGDATGFSACKGKSSGTGITKFTFTY